MSPPVEYRTFRPDVSASGNMDADFAVLSIEVWADSQHDRFGIVLEESNARIEAVLCRDDMVALRDRITEVLEATQ